ncbi:MAG: phenylalanine--tRNA ligase subunit beta [Candidatus Pacebacteria bacterium]|nr:phenylalanine--tRNA ligase subunit beta [Candidatus Paceibacterota bacterium]
MKYSYNWLKDYISGTIPDPKKLAEALMGRSFEIDSLEKKTGDWVLDIKVLSNRAADCLSHMGIAREIAVILQRKMKLPPAPGLPKSANKRAREIKVKIESLRDCPRYTALVIKGVKAGPSPRWLKSRLEVCGLQSINNIVDITNYVMLETGQPLHAFDADKLGTDIIVRRARKGELIRTLDKEKTNIVLDENVLVIADSGKPVAIAGIKGGAETGIDESTKNIIVEAANFNPVLIRRASQKIKIRTDASWRFENGLDLHLIDLAQARAAYLIKRIATGGAESFIDVSSALPEPRRIRLGFSYLDGLLGAKISSVLAVKILKSLGCRIIESSKRGVLVQAPSQRLDLKTSEDLIEEIGRVWGYEKLPKTFPEVILTVPQINKNWIIENKAKDALASLGFSEAYNYTFIGEKDKEIFSYRDSDLLEIANPVSELNKFLRPSLAPCLLKNTKENLKNSSEIKMFEIGKVFVNRKERLHLGIIAAGKKRTSDLFFEVKGTLEATMNELGVNDFSFVGALSPVNTALLERLGIKANVILGEIDFQDILTSANERKKYQPVSAYPASLRDVAVLTPETAKAIEVLEVIKDAGGKLLVEAELFDIYSGPGLPQGKKNLAFHLVYQSSEKTLSAEEVNNVHRKIFEAIEGAGWEVRK